jgi:hypothetical protein
MSPAVAGETGRAVPTVEGEVGRVPTAGCAVPAARGEGVSAAGPSADGTVTAEDPTPCAVSSAVPAAVGGTTGGFMGTVARPRLTPVAPAPGGGSAGPTTADPDDSLCGAGAAFPQVTPVRDG